MAQQRNADKGARGSVPPLTLVLGGARSGKSALAESCLAHWPGERVYLATAQAGDAEMAARIAAHRRRRGTRWRTVEAPVDLAGALAAAGGAETAVLVDCLTLWLANVVAAGRDPAEERARLLEALASVPSPVVMVSNEVGLGIVPDNALARRFRDAAGRLHQELAAAADRVLFVAAGLPLTLKSCARVARSTGAAEARAEEAGAEEAGAEDAAAEDAPAKAPAADRARAHGEGG